MSPRFLQNLIDGEEGDDAQFEAVKFAVKQQIDRAFSSFMVKGGDNFQVRESLHGYHIAYNERGSFRSGARSRR